MASHGSSFQKTFMGAAGGGAGLDVNEVFSTYLYEGTGSNKTITNGIDLSGEGGMVWIKSRTATRHNSLFDTERGTGTGGRLSSNTSSTASTASNYLNSFNSNGFTIGTDTTVNNSGEDIVSWTFRKAPKFFDVVTYTGSGSAKTVAHSLGSAPGMIIIKNTGVADPWAVYHRANTAAPQTDYLVLNTTAATVDSAAWWNDTAPTSSVFTVGTDHSVNANGETYVAYIFAHNDGDGKFGPDADQDIIKCGSYTGNGNDDGPEIDLGFEPQWVMVKNIVDADSWYIFDVMRGMVVGGTNDAALRADSSGAETGTSGERAISPTPTGFKITTNQGWINNNNTTLIYMAIRRGPLNPPESATEVFDAQSVSWSSGTNRDVGFAADLILSKIKDIGASGAGVMDRMRGFPSTNSASSGSPILHTHSNSAENTGTRPYVYDVNNTSFKDGSYLSGYNGVYWSWRRAPGFCDVVGYTGNGSSGLTVSHNLTVVPEMMWVKRRDNTDIWAVYTEATGKTGFLRLNDTNTLTTTSASWNNTSPTSTVFTLGNYAAVNTNNSTYIAYLFATLDGISKVGSVTHSGTTNVDCGFSNGSRFVLLKRTDATGGWYIWDSVRGIIAGNDPYFLLNTTAAQVTNTDYIDPLSSGFTISDAFTDGDYIFYAIA